MEFYKSRNFTRKKNTNKFNSERISSYRNSKREKQFSSNNRKNDSTIVTCADCGIECEIPFVPKHDRPVYCSDCFKQNKPNTLENERFSKNDRKTRFSKQQKSRFSYDYNNHKIKPKSEKILKRQESLFSGGSEKFYASLKEKLFEILGGKICSNCGFRDARALGVCHIHDDSVFDNIQRGGFASSWGKYISEPDLARQELRVLCLNCNEIRQPISKSKKENNLKPKRKKSRYFPR